MTTRILLIKLGALGDVLRTTSLLPALKKKWPAARVTWVLAEPARPLVARNGDVAEILSIESLDSNAARFARLTRESWDVLINLDEDPRATRISTDLVKAGEKFGIGCDPQGKLIPLSPAALHLVRLAADDRLKFRENQMPFQALIHQAVGLRWLGEPYAYVPPPDLAERRKKLFSGIPKSKRAGIFVGASERYANKFWSESEIARFCLQIQSEVFLFGGPSERARLENLGRTDPCRSLPRFAADTLDDLAGLVAACDLLICGDTLAMHLAIAMQIPLIVLFGPTAHAEITLNGRKIITPYSCGPCYLRECDITPSCMSAIRPERVIRAIREFL